MPHPGQTTKQLVLRGDNPDDCWLWLGSTNKKTGYGKKQINGRTELAHRWVWETINGPIPTGLVINHKCSNRSCVNPHHLEVVTQADNCRHGSGTKLTADQVRDIKNAGLCRKWGDAKHLSEKYGVSSSLIQDIWNGRAWKDIQI